jgi:hypothetical protein
MITNRQPAVIRIESPVGARASHSLPIGRSTVGRDPDVGVSIPSEYVSRRHAELHWDGEHLSVRDLGSQNGTHVNDRPAGDWVELSDGDAVRFGPVEAVVDLHGPAAGHSSSDTQEPTPPPEPPAARRVGPTAARTAPPSQVPIFVSHSSEDKAAARTIADHLTRAGWTVWIDEAGIAGGKQWHGELMRALEDAWIVLLVVSFHSMRSRWVVREVQAADRLELTVIPVVVDDAPYPDELRLILSGVQQVPLTEGRDAGRRKRQLANLDEALLQAARAGRPGRPGTALIAVGTTVTAIGAIGCLIGFALFAYLGITEVSDPSIGGGGIPRPFIGWGLFAVSVVIVGVGQGIRRSGLKKGI